MVAVTAAASLSMALQRHPKQQLAPSSGPSTHPSTHPGWLHCRTLLFDGQCFGEVAFFTEIPQLEFVRTVRCAACQHYQLSLSSPARSLPAPMRFMQTAWSKRGQVEHSLVVGLVQQTIPSSKLDTCATAAGTRDAAEKQVLHLRHARTALCFASCCTARSVSCIMAVLALTSAASSAPNWLLVRCIAACAASWLCPEPRTTASRQPSPLVRGRC